MSENSKQPTAELYEWASECFDEFNVRLFDGDLPSVMITMQRDRKTDGYFSPDRWSSSTAERCHELSLNPIFFASRSVIDVYQTLVHNMVHLWQEVKGEKKSRVTYHDKEFSEKMESIGLMTSSTGAPGGKRVGQTMREYPIAGGKFIRACEEMVKRDFEMRWVDRYPADVVASQEIVEDATVNEPDEGDITSEVLDAANNGELDTSEDDEVIDTPVSTTVAFDGEDVEGKESQEELPSQNLADMIEDPATKAALMTPVSELVEDVIAPTDQKKTKTKAKPKYTCGGCKLNVWGKPGLKIKCMGCDKELVEAKPS